jgi:hypothetical protein
LQSFFNQFLGFKIQRPGEVNNFHYSITEAVFLSGLN